MAKRQGHQSTASGGRPHHYPGLVFVLWGPNFEEVAATLFLTTMREAGLRTELVGLTSREVAGAHGLILHCDLTLTEALPLAERAICVVLPCSSATLREVENDPRLQLFFQKSLVNTPVWVIPNISVLTQSNLKVLLAPTLELVHYGSGTELIQTGQIVARRLNQRLSSK